MRLTIWAMTLTLPVAGCASAPAISLKAFCDGTADLRQAHAAALLEDGGDRSVTTGAALISATDSVCPADEAMK